jgi:hypothetical protein
VAEHSAFGATRRFKELARWRHPVGEKHDDLSYQPVGVKMRLTNTSPSEINNKPQFKYRNSNASRTSKTTG